MASDRQVIGMRGWASICWALLMVVGCSSGGDGSAAPAGGSSSSSGSGSSSSSGAIAEGSHRTGESCMSSSCHDGASSAQKFTVAGTVYRSGRVPNTSAEIHLFVAGTNTLRAELATDASGNFYSTEPFDEINPSAGQFVVGMDVEVHGSVGITNMPGVISSGNCNGCHGQSNGVITAN